MTAQGIEAGTGETEGLDPQGESPVRQDAPYILPPPLRDDGPLETMARAIIEAQGYSPSENELARARDEVPGILAALTEAGYAIVPVDPTEAMLDAYWDTIEGHPDRAEGTEPYPLGITVYHALVNAGKVEG